MRVLVVDDDKPVANFIRRSLEAEQYAVDVARDGEEARFLAEVCDYDLVILDLGLPRLDGLDDLKGVRSRKMLPVLALTGRNGGPGRTNGLDQGADDYLSKPFSFAELSARVRALLCRRTLPLAKVT